MSSVREAMTREEVAALVCTTLERHGIRVALSGGAVVSIYSENEYESYDLDFIVMGLAKKTTAAMEELGFHKRGRHWRHPDTPFWVELPPGPVQVGDTVVTEFAERVTRFGALRLLTPTECVMDRLAGYYHWNDPQGLDQAVAVGRRHAVDLRRIEAWSERENAMDRFRDFVERLSKAR
ncbi:MAG: hypothetical protein ACE5JI_11145 [Acidobacteriota bacterium]